ncbi:MAG: tRNA (adenine(22)-N(1))-methyltransferase TrmK [Cellvibrionaceae bacterium]
MTTPTPKSPYLGARLRALLERIETYQLGNTPYHTLWDCCCDHGYLGIKLLHKGLCQHLHFNDQVPHLIDDLIDRLNHYPSEYFKPSYSAAVMDAGQLQLNDAHHNLMILAGIGGEHMIDILNPLLENHPEMSVDFLFCPATTQFDLREYLAENNFELLYESLVTERNRDYEIIHARFSPDPRPEHIGVSRTGAFWQADDEIHQRYLRKLIRHYQRCTQGDEKIEAQRILSFYLELWQEVTKEPYR